MNKLTSRFTFMACIAAIFSWTGCTSDIAPEITSLEVSRLFSPVEIEARVVAQTSARLNWRQVRNATTYTVEFFETEGLDFSGSPFRTLSGVTFDQLPLTVPGFAGETNYAVRVKAVGVDIADSKWITATFMTDAEQIFHPVDPDEIMANEVTLRWTAGEVATSIVLVPGNITHVITPAEIVAGAATVRGLTGETRYTATLRYGTKTRGTLVFTTLIDLFGATAVYPEDNLNTVIQAAEPGDVLALFPGTYTVHQGDIVINKSITIKGVFPHNKPVLNNRFTIGAGVVDFSIKDIELVGTYGSPAVTLFQPFVLTTGNYTINSIRIEGCIIRNYSRALIQDGGAIARVNLLLIDNCIISNIVSDGGDFIDFRVGHVVNLTITNSTFNRVATFPRDFIRLDNSSANFPGSTSTVLIDRCTFFQVSSSIVRRILYVRFVNNVSTVTNTIFAGADATYAGNFSNQPLTTQPVCSGNNYWNAPNFLSGIVNGRFDISGNHTTLNPGFVNADAGNFRVTNEELIFRRVGDPRWLP